MIEKMKVAYIVAQATHKTELLDTLRDLGILHLAEKKKPDSALSERFAALSRLSLELKDYAPEKAETKKLVERYSMLHLAA